MKIHAEHTRLYLNQIKLKQNLTSEKLKSLVNNQVFFKWPQNFLELFEKVAIGGFGRGRDKAFATPAQYLFSLDESQWACAIICLSSTI